MAASISGVGVGLGLSCSTKLSKTLPSSRSSGFRVKMTVSVEDKKKNYTLQKSEEAFDAAKVIINSSPSALFFVLVDCLNLDKLSLYFFLKFIFYLDMSKCKSFDWFVPFGLVVEGVN